MYQKKEFSLRKIDINIFKEYDIRGKIGKELNTEVAYILGQLFSANVKKGNIVVGKDNRLSSIELLDAFSKGLISCGCRVIELQDVSTSPYLYFASWHLKAKAAVMITGSHNPLNENGFKFLLDNKPFFGNKLKTILTNNIIQDSGSHEIIDLKNEYIQKITQNISIRKKRKIVWECNNSGNGKFLRQLTSGLSNRILNEENEGNFKYSKPDPLDRESLREIKEKVSNFDLGFAFDGDGDRLVFIGNNGLELSSDQLIYIFAQSLREQRNKTILLDTKASQILIDKLEEEGFKVILAPSGHSLMKERIIKENAIFAGEASGHYIFNDGKYLAIDDALYAALRLVEYLELEDLKLLPLPRVSREYRIKKHLGYDSRIYSPEGFRINFNGGFLLIRASNTEDYILIKYESNN